MTVDQKNLASHYLRKNLSLAWPLALNAFLLQSMLIIDTLLVSPLGEVPLASLGIATTILAFFIGLQIAFGNGTQLLVGRIVGAKDSAGLRRTFCDGVIISLIAALLFYTVIVAFGDAFIGLLTDDLALKAQANEYLSICKYLLFANALSQTLTVFLNGRGDTKTPFKVYLLEIPFNVGVSYLLIFGVDALAFNGLGVAGAALGSVAAVLFRLLLLSIHVLKLPEMRGFYKVGIISLVGLRSHILEILPVATNFVVLSLGNTIYQLLFSQLDIYSYVAVTLIFPWLRIATQMTVAWAQANSISITHAIGQQRYSDLQAIVKSCTQLGFLIASVVSLALWVLSQFVEMIYPKVEPQTLIAIAAITPLYICLPLVRTYNTVAGNTLRAMGKSMQVLKIHFFTQWLVVLPLCALFVLYLKLPLFWVFALLPIEELIKAVPFYQMLRKTVTEVAA